MIEGRFPEKEHKIDELAVEGGKHETTPLQVDSLYSIAVTHQLIQPYLIECHFDLPESPLSLMANALNQDIHVIAVTFPKAIVATKETVIYKNSPWVNSLCAIPLEVWEPASKFLSEIAGVHRHKKEYRRVRGKTIRIKDVRHHPGLIPGFTDEKDIPEIPIVVYDILGSKRCLHLDLYRSYPTLNFEVRAAPPDETCKQIADIFFADTDVDATDVTKAVDLLGKNDHPARD